jgi:hypothetical protein
MALSKLAKRRLATLVEYMSKLKVAGGHFKMKHWVAHRGKACDIDIHGLKDAARVEAKHLVECGMSACAVGWACTVPAFRKAGLMMSFDDCRYLRPMYRGEEQFDAVTEFFDIDETRARRLFGPYRRGVNSPKEWAEDAKKVVAKWSSTAR